MTYRNTLASVGVQNCCPSQPNDKLRVGLSAHKLDLGGLLHFFLGVSLFTPALSIVNVGNHTGFQSALVLVGLCGIFRVSRGRLRKDVPVFILLITWAIGLVITVLLAGGKPRFVHSLVGMEVCLLITAIFSMKWNTPESYDLGLQYGLLAGAVLSAIYALYQQAAFRFGFPFGVPPLNNPSFWLVNADADRGVRSFAFFPEPSMLAAYLIPFAIATLSLATSQNGLRAFFSGLISILLFIGLAASGSFSIFISLPIALILCLFAQGRGLIGMMKATAALIFVGFLFVFLLGACDWTARLSEFLLARITNVTADPSLITRYGRNVASLRVFEENPVFGSGVIPDPDYYYVRMPRETTIYQSAESLGGGDNLLMSIASGQGICGLFCFGLLILIAVRRTARNTFLQSALIGCVVVMTIQCPNFELYLIWVVLGLCLGQRAKSPMTVYQTPSRLMTPERESVSLYENGK